MLGVRSGAIDRRREVQESERSHGCLMTDESSGSGNWEASDGEEKGGDKQWFFYFSSGVYSWRKGEF